MIRINLLGRTRQERHGLKPQRKPRFWDLLRRFGSRIQAFLSRNPEAIRAKAQVAEARGQARVNRTHARQSFFRVLLDRWFRYRLTSLEKKKAHALAKADAKVKLTAAKTAAYERKQILKFEKRSASLERKRQIQERKLVAKRQRVAERQKRKAEKQKEVREGFGILHQPSLLLIAFPLTATVVSIAFHLNWLWPILLWLTIWLTVYSTIGWKMKILNFVAISGWAILAFAHLTNQ